MFVLSVPAVHKLANVLIALMVIFASEPVWHTPPSALAAPVVPEVITLVQPDGTTFGAVPFGDEWSSGYETTEGYTIIRDDTTAFWSYAALNATGRLVASPLRPGRDRPTHLNKHLRDSRNMPLSPTLAKGKSTEPADNIGTQRVLGILVQFADRPSVGSTSAEWSAKLFGATASLKDYYEEVSYGQLVFAPVNETDGTANDGIVGWLTLPYNHPNTRANTGDVNRQITRDAITAADPYIDYAAYDTNGDGHISSQELHIVVIVAGYEAAYGGATDACSPSIWSHQWAFGGTITAPIVDGEIVGDYSAGGGYVQVAEWHCSSTDTPGHSATIGVPAHEVGHDLGWPDLYDLDYSSYGVGYWSLMGTGLWLPTSGSRGSMPSHPDAFLKWYQGWLTPFQVLTVQVGLPIQQAETNEHVIQLLDNPGGVDWRFNGHSGTGEYFLVENRQKIGYDEGLPGCGLVVWHIDETRTFWNTANTTDSRRLVDLEEADGLQHLDLKTNSGDAGDPYPGSSRNPVLSDVSQPNSRLYSNLDSNVRMNVTSSGCSSTMTADLLTIELPVRLYFPMIWK